MQLEDIRGLVRDDEGVSPVIGVILMVAITVILAAVIGTFVLGLGDDVTESTAPTADFDFDYDGDAELDDANSEGEWVDAVAVTHAGGDSIPDTELSVGGDAQGLTESDTDDEDQINVWDGDVTAGDSQTAVVDEDPDGDSVGFSSGDTVQVVWEADGADSSQVLAEYDVPAE